ncbi:MAG: sulfotransferase domain-containing protein [Pseudomonadota bacterium]
MIDDTLLAELTECVGLMRKDNECDTPADVLITSGHTNDSIKDLRNRHGTIGGDRGSLIMIVRHAKAGRIHEALGEMVYAPNAVAFPAVHRLIRRMEAAAPARDPDMPFIDAQGTPVVFVVSYPRSGNSRLTSTLDGAFVRSRFSIYPSDGRYFSKKLPYFPVDGPVFVKSHIIEDSYRHNPIIYSVRDGRDAFLSLNDFVFRAMNDAKRADHTDMADGFQALLERVLPKEHYGYWPAHANRALAFSKEHGNVHFVRFEEITSAVEYERLRDTLRSCGVALSRTQFEAGVARAKAVEDVLRSQIRQWSREAVFPEGSLMARWMALKGSSKWQRLLSVEDKTYLHEAGITKPLMEFGYETDPDWWSRP